MTSYISSYDTAEETIVAATIVGRLVGDAGLPDDYDLDAATGDLLCAMYEIDSNLMGDDPTKYAAMQALARVLAYSEAKTGANSKLHTSPEALSVERTRPEFRSTSR